MHCVTFFIEQSIYLEEFHQSMATHFRTLFLVKRIVVLPLCISSIGPCFPRFMSSQ